MGFLLDQKSLKTGALHVKRSFTCRSHVELCQEVVNLKNEVDRKEETFGEEFHTLGQIFLCIEHAHGLKVQNVHIELSMVLTKL
jgi:3,4-dihydroxy-2-butanone 4-phosphate synthase